MTLACIGGVEEVFSEQFFKVPKVPESQMEAGRRINHSGAHTNSRRGAPPLLSLFLSSHFYFLPSC